MKAGIWWEKPRHLRNAGAKMIDVIFFDDNKSRVKKQLPENLLESVRKTIARDEAIKKGFQGFQMQGTTEITWLEPGVRRFKSGAKCPTCKKKMFQTDNHKIYCNQCNGVFELAEK